MNYLGLGVIGLAVIVIIIGFRGTQAPSWHSLTGL